MKHKNSNPEIKVCSDSFFIKLEDYGIKVQTIAVVKVLKESKILVAAAFD